MAYSRYTRREMFLNNDNNYRKAFFVDRDIEETFQYDTPKISFPNDDVIRSLTNVLLLWSSTDKLYNVANKYYGSPKYWWVIAWYNQAPTESHFSVGDTISIPLPLDRILDFYNV